VWAEGLLSLPGSPPGSTRRGRVAVDPRLADPQWFPAGTWDSLRPKSATGSADTQGVGSSTLTPPVDQAPDEEIRRVLSLRGSPGQLFVAFVCVTLAGVGVLLVWEGAHNAVDSPFWTQVSPLSGYRGVFLTPRFVAYLVPLILVIPVLLVGSVGIIVYRGQLRLDSPGPGLITRWSVRLSALLVLMTAASGAVLSLLAIWNPGTQPHPLIIDPILTVLLLLTGLGSVRTLRSSRFRVGMPTAGLSTVVLVGVLSISYLAAQENGTDGYLTSGFHTTVAAPDPQLVEPVQAACGDQDHCVVTGLVAAIPNGPLYGVESTADGGHTWHGVITSIQLGTFQGTLTCRGSECWDLLAGSERNNGIQLQTISIDAAGMPHASVPNVASLPNQLDGRDISRAVVVANTCWSAVNCVAIRRLDTWSGRPQRDTVSLYSSATSDGGQNWMSGPIELPVGVTPEIDIPPRMGPQCDSSGTCVVFIGLRATNCTGGACVSSVAAVRSTDGGVTWTVKAVPIKIAQNTVLDPSCQGIPTCTIDIASTGGPDDYTITRDAGLTWGPLEPVGAPGTVKCGSGTECMRSLSSGVAAESRDGGRTWVALHGSLMPRQAQAVMGCSGSVGCLLASGPGVDALGRADAVVVSPDGSWTSAGLPQPSLAR